jgi:phosphatidyl-myo-inositol alpha-mannosyltransferase
MRIGLTSPFAHPEVRRGAERYVAELSCWLTRRGHEVTVVTSTSGATRDEPDPCGVPVRYRRRGRPIGRGRLALDDLLRTTGPVARGCAGSDWQVLQTHHWADAAAVAVAPATRRVPRVLWLPGTPRRASLGGRPLHRAAFGLARRGAARITVLSDYARDWLRRDFGLDALVIPPGVDTGIYEGQRPALEHPTVLCTAAADDPRKQVDLLVRAFTHLARQRPDVRLVLAPPRPEAAEVLVADLDPDVRDRVEVRSITDPRELAAAYRAATVAVLPSLHEAFGLVMVEALAAGTPVVGTDHGAIPEVVDDPAIGRLFPPGDAEALAVAIADVLDLSADPATEPRCRAAARRWDWSVIGPRLEEVYVDVVR